MAVEREKNREIRLRAKTKRTAAFIADPVAMAA
jgi:hypothetical protein